MHIDQMMEMRGFNPINAEQRDVLYWCITPRHVKVTARSFQCQTCQIINIKLLSGAVIYYKGLMVTLSWSGIILTHNFRKSRTVLILGGVIPPCLPVLHPLHQGSIEQA